MLRVTRSEQGTRAAPSGGVQGPLDTTPRGEPGEQVGRG
jgi:hypothetical protein